MCACVCVCMCVISELLTYQFGLRIGIEIQNLSSILKNTSSEAYMDLEESIRQQVTDLERKSIDVGGLKRQRDRDRQTDRQREGKREREGVGEGREGMQTYRLPARKGGRLC